MNTKDKVLALLEKSRGSSLSGEEIAAVLNVSRTAVWKAVNALRKDGHGVCAATNRGYSLSGTDDTLSVGGMLPWLENRSYAENIHIYKSLESTNRTAKEMALGAAAHGTAVIADKQTAGRGRYGRSFYSPPGSGLYMSLILSPAALGVKTATLITAVAAISVCAAIEAVCGKQTSIKWVNDILLDGRKICGILTEAVTGFESGEIDWVAAGIGVNVTTGDFPGELDKTAISLMPEEGGVRNRLAAEIINELLRPGAWSDAEKIRAEYKKRLVWLGGIVTVLHLSGSYDALALDIDSDCRLIVKKEDGETAVLSSGEISIRNAV